jgi:hypothetical protein
VPGLPEYRRFIAELEAELARVETELSAAGRPGAPCTMGCAGCCLPLTVLPIESFAILEECEPWDPEPSDWSGGQACAFLLPNRSCAIYGARPYLCRVRGAPILHLNEDGEWERDSCARRGYGTLPGAGPGLRLETWNARLYRLSLAFCGERGIPPRRVPLSELRAAPRRRVVPA